MHLTHFLMASFGLVRFSSSTGLDEQAPLATLRPGTCNCTGTNNTGPSGKPYICRDPRLGPRLLPRRFPLLSFVSDYDRFGGEKPAEFLERWTGKDGSYVYPPQNGFMINDLGNPILGNMTLLPGTKVDRFGSEYGAYISAADAPYSQRALPPSSLDSPTDSPDYPYSYHIYTVLKPLDVEGGPIAPWFGQPGLGAQFYIGYTAQNIMMALEMGYLERVNKTEMKTGPGSGGECGL